ncbi:hypothetical protein OIU78_026202 [Salix suchowensis]|nr:hypothetical protein OIU78_026202 [Salix suchowensis]
MLRFAITLFLKIFKIRKVRSESGMYCSAFRVLKSTSRSLEDNYYEAWLQAMGEYDAEVPELEGEENLIAAAKQIVRALGSKKEPYR